MSEQRVLPADVYDTLEFSALAFGGIGAGLWSDNDGQPVCIQGHALVDGSVFSCVSRARLSIVTNDTAVAQINKRRGREPEARVTWKEYTRELNIVRGDS